MKRQVAFTLRFDPSFYERVKTVSENDGQSITSFVKDAIRKRLNEKDEAALFDAFTLVGEDGDEACVAFAHNAQREVELKDDE